jgi:hypothetical protein
MIVGAVWVGLWLAGVFGAVQLLRLWMTWRTPATRRACLMDREHLVFLGLWIVPMVLAGLGLYTFMPGHILNYFTALAILAGWAVTTLGDESAGRSQFVSGAALGLIVAANVGEFLFQPRWADRFLLGLPVTGAEVRRHDQQLQSWFATIRSHYHPESIVICHAQQWFLWGFRQFQYHLPEYRNVLLTPNRSLPGPLGEKLCIAHRRKTDFVDRLSLPPHGTVVLIVPPLECVDAFQKHFRVGEATVVPGSEGALYTLPADVATRGL